MAQADPKALYQSIRDGIVDELVTNAASPEQAERIRNRAEDGHSSIGMMITGMADRALIVALGVHADAADHLREIAVLGKALDAQVTA